jgi:hypothetical protein
MLVSVGTVARSSLCRAELPRTARTIRRPQPERIDGNEIGIDRLSIRTDQIDQREFATFEPLRFHGGNNRSLNPSQFHGYNPWLILIPNLLPAEFIAKQQIGSLSKTGAISCT